MIMEFAILEYEGDYDCIQTGAASRTLTACDPGVSSESKWLTSRMSGHMLLGAVVKLSTESSSRYALA